MPVKVFQPSVYKEEIKEKLRAGDKPEKIATEYPLKIRTIYRYMKEVQDEKEGKAPPDKHGRITPPSSIVPGVSKEAFTPTGAPAPAPPGAPTQEYVTLGTFRFPLEDWGYSSSLNLLIVAETFTQARAEYDMPKSMKVGDFVANLCQAFRLMKGWDMIGAGYQRQGDGENDD